MFFDADESLVAEDTDTATDVYLREADGTFRLLSDGTANDTNVAAFFGGVSPDGARVFFTAAESLLPEEDTDNVTDVYSREADGSLLLLSDDGSADPDLNVAAFFGGVSPDGARVFFDTADRLADGDTDGGFFDVYSREADGSLLLVSDDASAIDLAASAGFRGVSADGARVFFETDERFLPGDTDNVTDVYSREADGSLLLLSDDQSADPDLNVAAFFGGVSPDGARVFVDTAESLLPDEDTDTVSDVYSRDLDGTLRLLSDDQSADPDLNVAAFFAGVSPDGARVFFTAAESLLPGDTDNVTDVYSREADGSLLLLSDDQSADPDPNVAAFFGGVSPDGARVFFEAAERLLAEDTDRADDVYSRDLDGSLRLLSDGTANPDPDANAEFGGVSADGARVFFTAKEQLVGADTDTSRDLYESAFAVPSFAGGARVTGRARVGSRVACVPGGFVGESLTSTIVWLRDGNPIVGAVGDGYTIVGADRGHRLACRVTLRNPIGSASQTSAAVLIDVRAPVVRISAPRCARKVRKAACQRLQHSVRAWGTLRGTVRDPEPASGIARVEVNLVRGSRARCQVYTGRRFVRAGCKAAAKRSIRAKVTRGRWTLRVRGLKAGRYTLRVRATDHAANTSKPTTRVLRLR